MAERAGNSLDKAASPQKLPAVRFSFFSVFRLSHYLYSNDFLLVFTTPSVLAGLSSELQTVLRMMLAQDPSERPTVSKLLALPSVWKHRWKRRIYLMIVEAMLTVVSCCQVMRLISLLIINLLIFVLNTSIKM